MAAMKYSRQRAAIKEFLMGRYDHPTADVVYENIKLIYPNISLGTVYRNLSLLSDIGEIQKLSHFGGADRFDARTDPHCHFTCTRCGRVTDLDDEKILQALRKAGEDFSGEIHSYTAEFSGLCEDCAKKAKSVKLS